VSILIGYGDLSFALSARNQINKFEGQVCAISTASQANSAHIHTLLAALADRAKSRQVIDLHDGNLTAAQADHDSALLYTTIAATINPHPGPGLGC
jgi:hypothetical protein